LTAPTLPTACEKALDAMKIGEAAMKPIAVKLVMSIRIFVSVSF
jgi:hypothetical protein